MQFLRGFFFGLILGVGITWFLFGTEAGRGYVDQAVAKIHGDAAPTTTLDGG